MQVVLLQKVENLGSIGDVVGVRAGYARNFLVPFGKALKATKANLAVFEERRAELEKNAQDELARATARAAELEDTSITIEANAGPGGKLFGSVGPAEVAAAITASGAAVEKSEVRLGEGPIRQIGEFEVGLHFHTDVDATITLVVVEQDAA